MAHVRQNKFPPTPAKVSWKFRDFILLVFKHASSMCLGKLHSSNGKLNSPFIDIKTSDHISKDAFLNTGGEPVAVGGGPVWVYCQKILNSNEIHDSNKEQTFHAQTSRSVCPRKTVKNPQGLFCSFAWLLILYYLVPAFSAEVVWSKVWQTAPEFSGIRINSAVREALGPWVARAPWQLGVDTEPQLQALPQPP